MSESELNNKLADSSVLYKDCKVSQSHIGNRSSVGDYSRIENSKLEDYVQIQRNNGIYSSTIKSHSYTGPNTLIFYSTIGKYCSISWNVSIGPANHNYKNLTTHSFLYNNYDKLRPEGVDPGYNRFEDLCTIGNDVWIAANAIILRGVTVGDGAVIAANSVVTKDIPPYAIVGGTPAKVLKYRFSEDIIAQLLNLKWWELPDSVISDHFNFFNSEPTEDSIKELFEIKKEAGGTY